MLMGAGAASATELCKSPENPDCLEAKTWWIGTTFEMALEEETSARFATTGFTVKCMSSKFELFLSEAGTPLEAKIEGMTFGNCENNCSAETRNQPILADIYKWSEASYDGKVLLVPRQGANPSWKLTCSGFSCIYGKEQIELWLESGTSPRLWGFERPLELEQGLFCPKEAKFTGSYAFDEGPIYVVGP